MILVTGAAGFIGSNFVRSWFLDTDEKVRKWYKERSSILDGSDVTQKKEWKDKYLKDLGDGKFEERQLVDLPESRQIYSGLY